MLGLGLELVACSLKLRQSYLFPAGAAPEDQAAQTDAWSAGIAFGAPLHDIGKIAVDVQVESQDGRLWQATHLISDHCKIVSGLTCPSGFNGRVERKQVSLLRDAGDHLKNLLDIHYFTSESLDIAAADNEVHYLNASIKNTRSELQLFCAI